MTKLKSEMIIDEMNEKMEEMIDKELVEERNKLAEEIKKMPVVDNQIDVKSITKEEQEKIKRYNFLVNSECLTELGKEYAKKYHDAIEEERGPEVLKNIGMRKGDIDIRQLSNRDYRQLAFRNATDTVFILNNAMMILANMQILLQALCEEKGIDYQKVLDDKN